MPGGGAEAKVETDSWSVGSYSSQAWGRTQHLIYTSLCRSSTVEYLSIHVGRVHSQWNSWPVPFVILTLWHLSLCDCNTCSSEASLRPHSGGLTMAMALPFCGYGISSRFIWIECGIKLS